MLDTAHVHHWRLEPPNGPTSVGHCACGESRVFANTEGDGKVSRRDWNSITAGKKGRKGDSDADRLICYCCGKAVRALYLRDGGVLNCTWCTRATLKVANLRDLCIVAYGIC